MPRRLMQLVGNWEQSCSKGAEDMTFVTLSAPIENGVRYFRRPLLPSLKAVNDKF